MTLSSYSSFNITVVLIEKKSVSYFIGEIFDSDARFGSSLIIYPENPTSWAISAVF